MVMVSQAEFARMKGVSKQAVTDWKKEGRLIIVDGRIDVEATEARLIPSSGSRTRRREPARQPGSVKMPGIDGRSCQLDGGSSTSSSRWSKVSEPWPVDIVINAGSGLPTEADLWCIMIETGAWDIGVILLRSGLPLDRVQAMVETWVCVQRRGACEVLDDQVSPPSGCTSWTEHESFRRPWLQEGGVTWRELAAEARQTVE